MNASMNGSTVEIAGVPIGERYPCPVIAEIGLNHNGELDMALRLIEASVRAGASFIKFQKRHVDGLAVDAVLDAQDSRFPSFGRTYREIRKHLEFGWEDFNRLKDASRAAGVPFLVTPFDIPSVEFLEKLGVPAYKIASHSVTNLPVLQKVAGIGKPVILSTGMCSWEELDEAVGVFQKQRTPLVLLHCISAYPTQPEEANLRLIPALRERYGTPVGYSGHEIGALQTLSAVALGAVVVERHVTLDRNLEGFDHKLSLNPDELADLVRSIGFVQSALGDGERKVSEREMITRRKYHVSAVTQRDVAAGEPLTLDALTFKNPGTGISPRHVQDILGRRAKTRIPADTLISPDMLEVA